MCGAINKKWPTAGSGLCSDQHKVLSNVRCVEPLTKSGRQKQCGCNMLVLSTWKYVHSVAVHTVISIKLNRKYIIDTCNLSIFCRRKTHSLIQTTPPSPFSSEIYLKPVCWEFQSERDGFMHPPKFLPHPENKISKEMAFFSCSSTYTANRSHAVVMWIKLYLVPNLLVLRPMKTDRMSFPKLAAFTASILLAAQCLR